MYLVVVRLYLYSMAICIAKIIRRFYEAKEYANQKNKK